MAGDAHGAETQEESQAAQKDGQQQAAQEQPQVSGKDWEKAISERDGRIAELEQQVADAAKNAETAEALRNQIAELKAQGESDRIDFQLQLAGVRNVKAARAVLSDHGGDVDALKEAEPWLFGKLSDSGLPVRARSAVRQKKVLTAEGKEHVTKGQEKDLTEGHEKVLTLRDCGGNPGP